MTVSIIVPKLGEVEADLMAVEGERDKYVLQCGNVWSLGDKFDLPD